MWGQPATAMELRGDNMAIDPSTEIETEEREAEAGVLEEYLVEEVSIDGMCGVY